MSISSSIREKINSEISTLSQQQMSDELLVAKLFVENASEHFNTELENWTQISNDFESLDLEYYIAEDFNYMLYLTNDSDLLRLRERYTDSSELFEKVKLRLAENFLTKENNQNFFNKNDLAKSGLDKMLSERFSITVKKTELGVSLIENSNSDKRVLKLLNRISQKELKSAFSDNTVNDLRSLFSGSDDCKKAARVIVKNEVDNMFQKRTYNRTGFVSVEQYNPHRVASCFDVDYDYNYKLDATSSLTNASDMIDKLMLRTENDLVIMNQLTTKNKSLLEKLDLAEKIIKQKAIESSINKSKLKNQ